MSSFQAISNGVIRNGEQMPILLLDEEDEPVNTNVTLGSAMSQCGTIITRKALVI